MNVNTWQLSHARPTYLSRHLHCPVSESHLPACSEPDSLHAHAVTVIGIHSTQTCNRSAIHICSQKLLNDSYSTQRSVYMNQSQIDLNIHQKKLKSKLLDKI